MREKKQSNEGINFFEKYLTIWVAGCMATGVVVGKYLQ